MKPGFDSDEQIVYLKRDDNNIKHPKTNKVVDAKYLIASAGFAPITDFKDRRTALAGWLTSEKNPFFAKAIVNRVWSYFLGRGIIEPVDDIRGSNPPINAELLDALEQDFVESGFDLQHLIRTIVASRTYQTGIETNKWNEGDELNFSRYVPRRLPAESLLDAITVATGSRPNFPEVPEDFTAQQLPDPHVGKGGFLDMFGRPDRESSCECERRNRVELAAGDEPREWAHAGGSDCRSRGSNCRSNCRRQVGSRIGRRVVSRNLQPLPNRCRDGSSVDVHAQGTGPHRAGTRFTLGTSELERVLV